MAIPDPPKAGSPFCDLQTGGWNPKTPEINNFLFPKFGSGGVTAPRSPVRISSYGKSNPKMNFTEFSSSSVRTDDNLNNRYPW